MDYKVEAGDLSEKVKREIGAIVASPAEGHLELWSPCLYDATDEIYYYPVDLPVTIPLGHRVFATVRYCNDDPDAAHELTCDAEFLNPAGVSKGAATATYTVPASGSQGMFTGTITLDKAGTWKIHATLNGLDEKTWPAIIIVGEGVWEWIKAHWEWIAGGVGAAAAIGVTVALLRRRK